MRINDRLITSLKRFVTYGVRFLAVLMALVIMWTIVDVAIALYREVLEEPFLRLSSDHMFSIFGSFLTVLIAIEIFLNIIVYLTKDVFHVQLVVATALTAVARKVIVLDYSSVNETLVYAIAAVVLAVAIAYWIVTPNKEINSQKDN